MTSPRIVYDTMIFVQWALLPAGRLHGTMSLFSEGLIELFLSDELEAEIVRALQYPELRSRAPHLTDNVIRSLVDSIRAKATRVVKVPERFLHSAHPKDNHIFDLAITASADFLITWERRYLEMDRMHPQVALQLRQLAPDLRIMTRRDLIAELRT